jgi:hypothetical protein
MPAADLSDEFLLKRELPDGHWLTIQIVAHLTTFPTEMKAEHCYMTGHSEQFDCWLHYEAGEAGKWPKTSARQEWDYIVNGHEPEWIKGYRLKSMYKDRVSRIYLEPDAGIQKILSDPERLGLALYTGPMVCKSLRSHALVLTLIGMCSSKSTTAYCAAA